jgi:uncharacterized protein
MISGPRRSQGLVLAWAFMSWGASCNRVPELEATKASSQETARTAAPAEVADGTAPPADPPTAGPWAGLSPCPIPLPPSPPLSQSPADVCPEPTHPPPEMPQGQVTFVDAPGQPRVTVEIARTVDHRAHGLMFRRHLSDQEGMLFSWRGEEPRSFWMRNTCLPLDMLFIAGDGTLLGILEQVPPMNDAPRTVPCPAMHVLEVPAGWSRRHGVVPGQRLSLSKH